MCLNSYPLHVGMVNAVQNIGVLFALPFAPFVSDKFGRKKALMTGAWIMLGGVALQTASTNIWHFVGSRGMSEHPQSLPPSICG